MEIHQGGFCVDRDRFWDPHLQVFIINLVIEKQLDLTAKRKGWIEGKEEGEIEGERRGIGMIREGTRSFNTTLFTTIKIIATLMSTTSAKEKKITTTTCNHLLSFGALIVSKMAW